MAAVVVAGVGLGLGLGLRRSQPLLEADPEALAPPAPELPHHGDGKGGKGGGPGGGGKRSNPRHVLDKRGGRPQGGSSEVRAAYEASVAACDGTAGGSVLVRLTSDALTRTVDSTKQRTHKPGSGRFRHANAGSEHAQEWAESLLESTAGLQVQHATSDALGIVSVDLTGAAGDDLDRLLDSRDVVSVEADCGVRLIPPPPEDWTDDEDGEGAARRLLTVETEVVMSSIGVDASKLHGSGVSVYVIDTGIDTTHPSFGGRAVPAWDNGEPCDATDTQCATDTDGHGTHCAGLVGSADYGVARGATIHAVKVSLCCARRCISSLAQVLRRRPVPVAGSGLG